MRPTLVFLLFSLTASAGAEHPYDAVCTVEMTDLGHYGSGTLIGVSENRGLVLTCAHVAKRVGEPVKLTWPVTREMASGTVLAVDTAMDLALVACDKPRLTKPVDVFCAYTGGDLVNVGFPAYDREYPGWQEGRWKSQTSTRLYYYTRPFPGMSGGATFDSRGRLVGVVIAYSRDDGVSVSGVAIGKFISRYKQ